MFILSGGQTGVDRAALDAAGPRESTTPGIYEAARRLLNDLFEALTPTRP